jgi:predicted nuclease of predicted toxin-antitoxin system
LVVVTKDSDFVESFLLRHEPWKLLLLSTGNKRVGVTGIQVNRFSKIRSGAIKIAFLIAVSGVN